MLAAGPIFAVRGYEKATVREICAAAGVNVSAINYYFGDKHQLYLETVALARHRRAEEVPLPEWPEDASPEDKLRGHVQTMVGRLMGLDGGPWETHLLMREMLNPTEACRALIEQHFRPQFETLTSVIGELLPPHATTQTKQRFAFSLIGQCVFYRAAEGVVSLLIPAPEINQHFNAQALAKHITETMLGALAAFGTKRSAVPSYAQTATAG